MPLVSEESGLEVAEMPLVRASQIEGGRDAPDLRAPTDDDIVQDLKAYMNHCIKQEKT